MSLLRFRLWIRSFQATFVISATIFIILISSQLYFQSHHGGSWNHFSSHDEAFGASGSDCTLAQAGKGLSSAAIRCRIKAAQSRMAHFLEAQSRTPEAAIAEYERRYGRPPPPGFREWVQFALDHDSRVIDDFDQIEIDLQPYRTDEARRVFHRLNEKYQDDWPKTRRVAFVDGHVNASGGLLYGDEWTTILAPFAHALPRKFLIYLSTIDEPRVLAKAGGMHPDDNVTFVDHQRRSIETLVKESCTGVEHRQVDEERDVCRSPEPGKLHALIASPSSFIYTQARVPILSFGRMSAFRDILVPCPCYVTNGVAPDEGKTDTDSFPFRDKLKTVYWRGRSTGGQALRATWRYGHRQRFVGFVHALQRAAEVFEVSRYFGGAAAVVRGWEGRTTRALRNAFDVQMGGYIQCDGEACSEMERVLGPAHFEAQQAERQFRYLFDLDGNSMSCRFYHLLSQPAVVLKQTWFEEWHDQRLIPWAHYIPVTMGMEELPSVMDFLINDPEGERLSAEIAAAGSAWSRRVLREIDLSIYVYRLLLEMAAIFGPLDEDEKVWETVTEQLL
ncbi:hypothetical protein BO86DRAFT_393101 [Aspergillus japonicus CBS 114.51]|uniref:Glycosyl transferase CAP10 domain-containing protein n=1 Tax=Aspergillus japonicus CBS 114.51 TaxID=1448312 RepID=A0A8T8WNE6_ASPJA|nr:hypothetical protein BO86DRAFT_393101 [Aspergillus japonicus CBS 114.51]RAH76919.1 hypothetical protein BO86DRAFT_393101 [Aspergillus japonicus CBS 114.51]